MRALDSLGNFSFSAAYSISKDGNFIAGLAGTLNGTRAIRWMSDGQSLNLGVLPGFQHSLGYDISNDGNVVVGYLSGSNNQTTAFVWSNSSGMIDAGINGHSTAFYGVSTDGKVAVGYDYTSHKAIIWDDETRQTRFC